MIQRNFFSSREWLVADSCEFFFFFFRHSLTISKLEVEEEDVDIGGSRGVEVEMMDFGEGEDVEVDGNEERSWPRLHPRRFVVPVVLLAVETDSFNSFFPLLLDSLKDKMLVKSLQKQKLKRQSFLLLIQ